MRLYLLTKDNDLNPAGTNHTDKTFAAFFMRELITESWSKAEVSHWIHTLPGLQEFLRNEFECDGKDLLFMHDERSKFKAMVENKSTELVFDDMFKEDVSPFDMFCFWEEVHRLFAYDSKQEVTMVCDGCLGIFSDTILQSNAAGTTDEESKVVVVVVPKTAFKSGNRTFYVSKSAFVVLEKMRRRRVIRNKRASTV